MELHLDLMVLETRTGLWCDTCLLPSAIEIDFVTAEHDTLRLFGGPHTCRACEGCEPADEDG